MQTLIARKSLKYQTRRLEAGDVFEATPRDAKLLIAIKKAEPAPVNLGGDERPAKGRAAKKSEPAAAPSVPEVVAQSEGVWGEYIETKAPKAQAEVAAETTVDQVVESEKGETEAETAPDDQA